MQLHHLKAFLVLAEELNFRRAADRLALTQPGLSEQLHQLERALGCRLFVRDRSGTRLSAAGESLLPLAAEAASAVEDFVGSARAIVGKQPMSANRSLRVGMVVDGIGSQTWPLLKAFNEKRPEVGIDVRSLRFGEAGDAIDRGTVDVVMQMGPSGDTEMQRVTTVSHDPMCAIVPERSPLVSNEPAELELVARLMTFETPLELGAVYRKHWTLQTLREAAPSNRLSTLREPPGNADLLAVVQRFVRIGGVALWPEGLPVPTRSGCLLLPLDRPLHSPRQILTNRRNDHAKALAQMVETTPDWRTSVSI